MIDAPQSVAEALAVGGHPVAVWRQPTGFGPIVWAGEFAAEHGSRPYWLDTQCRERSVVRLGTSVGTVLAALESDLPRMLGWGTPMSAADVVDQRTGLPLAAEAVNTDVVRRMLDPALVPWTDVNQHVVLAVFEAYVQLAERHTVAMRALEALLRGIDPSFTGPADEGQP